MSLRKTKKIDLDGELEVVAKELTPAEVADLMDELEDYVPHLLDLMVDQKLPMIAVMASTGLTEEELMQIPFSGLDRIYREVQELNPSIAVLSERLKIIGEKVKEMRSEKRPANS